MKYNFPSPHGSLFPSMVVVSVTNACDFDCGHCFYPHYIKSAGYQRHDMESAIFKKIADEMGEYPGSILRLIAWGEPLLHPNIEQLIRYARRAAPQSPITLITNGYLLTANKSEKLILAGLNLVEVSIDAATAETYSRVRPSKHKSAFSTVEKNVQAMVQIRNKLGLSTRMAVSFIVYPTDESKAEYEFFRQKWAVVVDEVIKRPAHTFKGILPVRGEQPKLRPPCHCLWARCNVNPWGQVNVCYNDWENKYVIGDLRYKNTTIADVWQSQELAYLRFQQYKGVFTGICKNCRDYNPNAWERPYELIVSRCNTAFSQKFVQPIACKRNTKCETNG